MVCANLCANTLRGNGLHLSLGIGSISASQIGHEGEQERKIFGSSMRRAIGIHCWRHPDPRKTHISCDACSQLTWTSSNGSPMEHRRRLFFNDQYPKAPEDTFHLRERGRSPGTTTVLVPFRRRASEAPKSPSGFSPRFVMSLLQGIFDGQGGASCRCGSCGRYGAHSYFEHRPGTACHLGASGLELQSWMHAGILITCVCIDTT